MSIWSRAADRIAEWRALRWLDRVDGSRTQVDATVLRSHRASLRRLSRRLDAVVANVEEAAAEGQQHIIAPSGSDWSWRPQLWAARQRTTSSVLAGGPLRFGAESAVFTDGGDNQVIARQTLTRNPGDATPYGLKIEVFQFSGSYVSVTIDLPPSAVRGLSVKHYLSARIDLAAEADMQCYAVLNLASGPNKERLVEGFRPSDRAIDVTFDLSGTHFDANRLERIWAEVIFEPKGMNAVHLRDVTLYRNLSREI